MGCDIHVMVEARTRPFGSEAWFNVDNWRHNAYYGQEGEPAMTVHPIYLDRNYEMFSYLAGVRNYGGNPSFGFDRGFPDDASMPTTVEYSRSAHCWCSGHHERRILTTHGMQGSKNSVCSLTRC